MEKTRLRVYILSHNRPEYLKQAVDSILNQTLKDFEIVISENSSKELDRQKILSTFANSERVKIIVRTPVLKPLDHFNKILSEAGNCEYFMLFHDDDLLLPSALEILYETILQNPNLSGVAANAFLLLDQKKTNTLFSPSLVEDKTFEKPGQLARQYINPKSILAPFPGYVYRSENIKNSRMHSKSGGKHSDVTFLLSLLENGPIVLVGKPLLYYRKHSENDSNEIQLRDIFSLKRALRRVPGIPAIEIAVFMNKILLKWSVQKFKRSFFFKLSCREKVVLFYTLKTVFSGKLFSQENKNE